VAQPGVHQELLSARVVLYVNQVTTRTYLVLLLSQVSVQSALQELILPRYLKLLRALVKLALVDPGVLQVLSRVQAVKLAQRGHIIALNVLLLQRVGARTVLLVLTRRLPTRAHVPSAVMDSTLSKVLQVAKLVRHAILGTTLLKAAQMAQTRSVESVAQAIMQEVRID